MGAAPHALLVLKDGHVGSEWFAETMARQPGTRFLFEMGPCITGSISGKMAFFSSTRHGCACTKEDCSLFRQDVASAPCFDALSRTFCRVLGGSHISVTSEAEATGPDRRGVRGAVQRGRAPPPGTRLIVTRAHPLYQCGRRRAAVRCGVRAAARSDLRSAPGD